MFKINKKRLLISIVLTVLSFFIIFVTVNNEFFARWIVLIVRTFLILGMFAGLVTAIYNLINTIFDK
jgi:hypothetical protein